MWFFFLEKIIWVPSYIKSSLHYLFFFFQAIGVDSELSEIFSVRINYLFSQAMVKFVIDIIWRIIFLYLKLKVDFLKSFPLLDS